MKKKNLLLGISFVLLAASSAQAEIPISENFPTDKCKNSYQFIDHRFPDLCIDTLAGMITVAGHTHSRQIIYVTQCGSSTRTRVDRYCLNIRDENGLGLASAGIDANANIILLGSNTTSRTLDMNNNRPAIEYLIQRLADYIQETR